MSLLRVIGNALDPDQRTELTARLVAAAGQAIVPDTPGWERYRQRRIERGILSGDVPLPVSIARGIGLHRQASELARAGMAVLDRPGALDDVEALKEAAELLAEARRAHDMAGPAIVLAAGGRRIAYGLGYF